jgi:hypothetical protein
VEELLYGDYPITQTELNHWVAYWTKKAKLEEQAAKKKS